MKLSPRVLNFHWVSKYADEEDVPIYVNVPLRELKHTRAAEKSDWMYHPVTRKRAPYKGQPFRIWINENDDIFLGEGNRIIHAWFGTALEGAGLTTEEIGTVKMHGIIYFLEDLVFITLNGRGPVPEALGQWAEGVVVKVNWNS